jgi:hypothetical protein
MPIPNRKENEDRQHFLSRCMSDEKLGEEFPDQKQRVAVCLSKATEDCSVLEGMDFLYDFNTFGYTEDLNEYNFIVPDDTDYEDMDGDVDQEELWDIAKDKPGLWENIRKKKEREGKNYKPAKRGDPDRPDPEAWKLAQSKNYKYMDPKTGEFFFFDRPGSYKKDNRYLIQAEAKKDSKVKLNKPFRTPNGPKKFSVYVKNDKGNVVKVNFGDPNMEIRRDDPERRKNFRARHQCDSNPGPKWKARYWSCKFWSSPKVSDLT